MFRDVLDKVKAKPLDRWMKGIGQVLVNIYMNDISPNDYDRLDSFVNSNFVDPKSGQRLTDGINAVWDHYLNRSNGSNSPEWRIDNEFEKSTPTHGTIQDRLKKDVITKFWHSSTKPRTPDEEKKLGHVCGLLSIHAAYKNGWLFDNPIIDPQRVMSPRTLHNVYGGGDPPEKVPVPLDKVPPVTEESIVTYLTPLSMDEIHAVVDENPDTQNQFEQSTHDAVEDLNNDVMTASAQSSDGSVQYQTVTEVLEGVNGKVRAVDPHAGIVPDYGNFRKVSGLFAAIAKDESTSASASAKDWDNLSDKQKAAAMDAYNKRMSIPMVLDDEQETEDEQETKDPEHESKPGK